MNLTGIHDTLTKREKQRIVFLWNRDNESPITPSVIPFLDIKKVYTMLHVSAKNHKQLYIRNWKIKGWDEVQETALLEKLRNHVNVFGMDPIDVDGKVVWTRL